MTSVMNFIRRVGKTVEKAEKSPQSLDFLWDKNSRPAPPHAGIYCVECGEPLRPDTVACPQCGMGNPVKWPGRN